MVFWSFTEQLAGKKTFFFFSAHPIIKTFAWHFHFLHLICDFQSPRFLLTSERQRRH